MFLHRLRRLSTIAIGIFVAMACGLFGRSLCELLGRPLETACRLALELLTGEESTVASLPSG
jgi:hypothetical protein